MSKHFCFVHIVIIRFAFKVGSKNHQNVRFATKMSEKPFEFIDNLFIFIIKTYYNININVIIINKTK